MYMKIFIQDMHIFNKFSDRNMEVKLTAFLRNYDRPTDQPTNRHVDMTPPVQLSLGHWDVTLPIIISIT